MMTNRNIKLIQDLAQNERVFGWYQSLQASLRDSAQRAIVMLKGPRAWCLQNRGVFSATNVVTLSNDQSLPDGIPFSKADNLLGQEAECVIYDLFSGVNSDVLCMASGLLHQGGVLVLMCPPEMTVSDDVYGRWQGTSAQQPVFLHYLVDQWSRYASFFCLSPDQSLPEVPLLPLSPLVELKDGLSEDQSRLLQQLDRWLEDQSKPYFLITADRGRGKSTSLGKFANGLRGFGRVIVSAASRAQAGILLQQLDDQTEVVFMAPDEIIRQRQQIDLLIIDESAMLPSSVLRQCIELASKTLMATTTGGYEGTGQGFLLKFIAGFKSKELISMQLHQAIRWGQKDLLEQSMNDALMLTPRVVKPDVDLENIEIELVAKTDLSKQLEQLREVYDLLASAHYRTRPSDLRQLMEDENQLVLLACDELRVVGVLLLNREGGFDVELSQEVFMGRRRPQGHLLAQMLTAQAGIKHFSCYQGYRVQRIAVAPNYRRKGLGRALMEKAEDLMKAHQMDYLGSSFALDQINAAFWKACGFQLVHVASGSGKSSGRQTVAVLKSNKAEVLSEIQSLQQRLQNDVVLRLLTYCNAMFWEDVRALLSLLSVSYEVNVQDQAVVEAFAYGHYGLDYALPVLQRYIIAHADVITDLDRKAQRLLIEKILLNYSWHTLLQQSNSEGRKSLLQNLREYIRKFYEYTSTPRI